MSDLKHYEVTMLWFGAKEELQETAARVLRERDALAARLRAIEGQDPVGWQRQ